eukprot:199150-Lingulodinium_polyedra.AAC.1
MGYVRVHQRVLSLQGAFAKISAISDMLMRGPAVLQERRLDLPILGGLVRMMQSSQVFGIPASRSPSGRGLYRLRSLSRHPQAQGLVRPRR